MSNVTLPPSSGAPALGAARLAAIAAVVALAGCSGPLVEFGKPGVTQAELKGDNDRCWAEAQQHAMPESERAALRSANVPLILTPIAGYAAANADHPKSAYRVRFFNACMRRLGYEVGLYRDNSEPETPSTSRRTAPSVE